jgi:hypothetical protein
VCTFFLSQQLKTHFFRFLFFVFVLLNTIFFNQYFFKNYCKIDRLICSLYLYLHVSNFFSVFLAPNGCHTVAVMYKKGDGVTQDERKFKYYRDLTLEIVKATGATVGTKKSTVSGM